LVRDGENLAVRLHATNVVTYHPDGRITLDSGGWRTVTTKDRIDKYAPINLWTRNGQWFVGPNWNYTGAEAIYQDGMVINPDLSFSGVMSLKEAKAEQKLRSEVRKYAKGYLAALKAGKVPAPSGGDCWYCSLKEVGTGKPLGELTDKGQNGHIREHMKKKYYVPSLAWNALEAMGASQVMRLNLAVYQGMTDQKPWPGDFVDEQIEKAIRRYCYRELGLAY
jgi:hypothetical protein